MLVLKTATFQLTVAACYCNVPSSGSTFVCNAMIATQAARRAGASAGCGSWKLVSSDDDTQQRAPTSPRVSLRAHIGADFHSSVLANAPGEKLLIMRRPVGNWTCHTISRLFLHRKLHLFLGK